MDIFLKIISGILVILGMILVGFVIGEKGWFDDKSRGLIAKLVTQIALPCYMLYTITQRFTAADLLKMLPALRFPALSMVVLLGIATAVAKIFAVRQDRRGLFISMFFNSNTIFVGLPINQALFGDASIPYVLIYYMCNTTFFWTLGTYLIQRDGEGEAQFDLKTSVKKVFSPPLMGFILGLVMVMLQIKLPAFLASDLQYLGNLTTPPIHDFHRFVGISCRREAVGSGKRSAPHSTRTLRGCSTPNGDHCLLGPSSKLDEASLYHPVRYASDDQCPGRCQTLRS